MDEYGDKCWEKELIMCYSWALELLNGNFERYPEVKSGIWIFTTRDYRHIFRKFNEDDILDCIEGLFFIISEYQEELSHIWIDGQYYEVSEILKKFIENNKKS